MIQATNKRWLTEEEWIDGWIDEWMNMDLNLNEAAFCSLHIVNFLMAWKPVTVIKPQEKTIVLRPIN